MESVAKLTLLKHANRTIESVCSNPNKLVLIACPVIWPRICCHITWHTWDQRSRAAVLPPGTRSRRVDSQSSLHQPQGNFHIRFLNKAEFLGRLIFTRFIWGSASLRDQVRKNRVSQCCCICLLNVNQCGSLGVQLIGAFNSCFHWYRLHLEAPVY